MAYDILFDADNKAIGLATMEGLTAEKLAARLEKPLGEIYRGRFRIVGNSFVSSSKGATYTYWSKVGPINIASVALMSSVADIEVYFFKGERGMSAYFGLDEAIEDGHPAERCLGHIALDKILLLSTSGVVNEFTTATMEVLKPYMGQE